MIDVIIGLQWGDEGKGKIVDYFAPRYDIIARFQGGPNAGHTLYIHNEKIVLHQLPSGVFHNNCINIIGNGVVLDPITLKNECEQVAKHGIDVRKNLFISEKTNIIIPTHRALDKASEGLKGVNKIGSTLKGIGPAYMDKTGRNAIRMCDILDKRFTSHYIKLRLKHQKLLDSLHFTEDISPWEDEFFEALEFIRTIPTKQVEYYMNEQLALGKKILAEGAQGSMLDVDFGTVPFVTSSTTISAGVCIGLGVPPQKINHVYGVTKAYCTRVGGGPFPTELKDQIGEKIREIGKEFGATTQRPRRCGWIDLVALKYSCMLNGVSHLIMTKIDILDSFSNLQACTEYAMANKTITKIPTQIESFNQLEPNYVSLKGWEQDSTHFTSASQIPKDMKNYIKFISNFLDIPISFVSNGPNREQIIIL